MRYLTLIAVVTVLVVGCDDSCNGDSCQAYAIAAGRVLNPEGAPVAGARLQSFVARVSQPCTVGNSLDSDNKVAAADGSFRLVMGGDGPRAEACGFIQVHPPAESGLRDTLVGPLSFSLASGPPIDSISIEIRLTQ